MQTPLVLVADVNARLAVDQQTALQMPHTALLIEPATLSAEISLQQRCTTSCMYSSISHYE